MSYMLGQLIQRLEQAPQDQVCPLGFGKPHSYRGYYECLEFTPKANVRVGDMLTEAKGALGKVFTGYKGGNYQMGEHTDVYLGEYGEAQGQTLGPMLIEFILGTPERFFSVDPYEPEEDDDRG